MERHPPAEDPRQKRSRATARRGHTEPSGALGTPVLPAPSSGRPALRPGCRLHGRDTGRSPAAVDGVLLLGAGGRSERVRTGPGTGGVRCRSTAALLRSNALFLTLSFFSGARSSLLSSLDSRGTVGEMLRCRVSRPHGPRMCPALRRPTEVVSERSWGHWLLLQVMAARRKGFTRTPPSPVMSGTGTVPPGCPGRVDPRPNRARPCLRCLVRPPLVRPRCRPRAP